MRENNPPRRRVRHEDGNPFRNRDDIVAFAKLCDFSRVFPKDSRDMCVQTAPPAGFRFVIRLDPSADKYVAVIFENTGTAAERSPECPPNRPAISPIRIDVHARGMDVPVFGRIVPAARKSVSQNELIQLIRLILRRVSPIRSRGMIRLTAAGNAHPRRGSAAALDSVSQIDLNHFHFSRLRFSGQAIKWANFDEGGA